MSNHCYSPMNFWISFWWVLMLTWWYYSGSLWSLADSCRDWLRKSVVTYFLGCQVKFLVTKDCILLVFTDVWWWAGTICCLSNNPLNEYKKWIKLWKLKVYPCKMCKTFIAQVSFTWYRMCIKSILIKNKSCFSYFAQGSLKTSLFCYYTLHESRVFSYSINNHNWFSGVFNPF